ncbi:hypothetical protein [Jidongwangia harbinensis]|uniref:hypothetical protein n=1 Tax=Jidongwangia harbinensis TaxID=2878561 RepID=UPI001CD92E1C|nr:hypothetical protein [Jidongwangia harbinensis]MCA2216842.1 hypothetical protein [Jidongwangia harbinensis]
MERGPLALFGAIVAVGLGPALWLGAQFGNVTVSPGKAPTVISEQQPDVGGRAGAAPDESATKLETKPRAEIKPLSDRPSPRPSRSATSTAPEPEPDPTTEPPATTTEPTPTDEPTTPPTENTTEPADPTPSDDESDPVTEQEPPPPDPGTNAAGTGPVLAGT